MLQHEERPATVDAGYAVSHERSKSLSPPYDAGGEAAPYCQGADLTEALQPMLEAVVRLGQSLGLRVVAEGVETVEQKDFLHERGCDEIQGYLLAKPLPPDQFVKFVREFAD